MTLRLLWFPLDMNDWSGPYIFLFVLPPPQAGEVGIRLYLVDYLLRKQGRNGEKWE